MPNANALGQAVYGAKDGTGSTIGSQIRIDHWLKTAMIEARKETYFGPLADSVTMPKNMGKTLKKYHYLPLLDVLNVNDQGIDAAGVVIANTEFYVSLSALVDTYAVEADATAAAAAINAVEAGVAVKAGSGPYTVTSSKLQLPRATDALASAVVTAVSGSVKTQARGNLYGSSKDPGTILGKLPALSEHGGRVNRVGFTRVEVEGSFDKFGFFDEYTQESLDFDTDSEMRMHINREMLAGAYEMTEDALQIDLLATAAANGTVVYAGNASSSATLGADDGVTVAINNPQVDDLVSYGDLLRLSIALDDNRTPKQTKVFTGTRLVDTKTISGGRIMYVGSALIPLLESMVDLHGNQAFTKVQHYAAGGTTLTGEIGSIGNFRIIVVPEMMKWDGAGSTAQDANVHATNGRYDVFPMLCVGDSAFSTIGFQTDGKSVKFKIYHKGPGEASADRFDPFGETGFMSIKWYYGFLSLRPERLGLIKTLAIM